ncbi:MAG: imidazoleglycerol-phosphate dehydratase HisB [Clostridiales bacterium]|nr:imidazoleglycerol-phosphate dehydratase HisB [Clostridiales bacterium]HCH67736.1 imidazoleglycerol-phosphate dehydratase HisB [Clostridiales bacterium]
MRKAEIKRKTNETDIYAEINLDGRGVGKIDTGIGFLDHMLALFARHGRFDLTVKCTGDLQVDGHHTVEDVGVCLGKVFLQAVGEKRGICRYGFTVLPMDEALILTAVDLSGRAYLGYGLNIRAGKVGDFDTELAEEFFYAFVRSAECTLHVKQLSGSNAHHIIEGAFKSFARSLRRAVATESGFEDEIPSTKGVL